MTKRARTERHRWVVDAIEEGIATIEEDGTRVVRLPRRLLPPGTREGSVLAVTREVEGSGVVLRIARDERGEAAALERSRRQLETETGDEGGDIVL